MNVLDELKRKDEEARALLSAEVDSVTVKIDELVTYRNSLYAEMKRRGYAVNAALAPTTNSPSSIAVIPAKPRIVVSKDELSLPERILDLLSDGVPRSLDEVFNAISGKPGLKRSTIANRLHEMKMHGRVATMPNDREGAQPGSYLYLFRKPIVIPESVKELMRKGETLADIIHRLAADGERRTARELFALVSSERPVASFHSFRAGFRRTRLVSAPSDRSDARPGERLFWLPKDEPTSPSTDIVQAPIDESDYPVDKLIWRLMSDGKPRTKVEIYEYVVRFNKTATAAIIHRHIIRAGLISEMNGTDRVYRSRIAGDPINSK